MQIIYLAVSILASAFLFRMLLNKTGKNRCGSILQHLMHGTKQGNIISH